MNANTNNLQTRGGNALPATLTAAQGLRPDYAQTRLQGITDLTVLAPIKRGLIDGILDTCTYVERLSRLLQTLNAGRIASRESALRDGPFSDLVGRLNIIHFFRFAIVPPDASQPDAPHHMLLNVTFDGGWEPYMRVIWRDLGSLLDAICCNCVGYPLARASSYETYIQWVREHEVRSNFFYADSATGIGDQRYQAAVEKMSRAGSDADAMDVLAATFVLESPAQALNHSKQASKRALMPAVQSGLRVLIAFNALARHYPGQPGHGNDADVLIRFTQDLLAEFRHLDNNGVFTRPELQAVARTYAAQLAWFRTTVTGFVPDPDRFSKDPSLVMPKIQGGIVNAYPNITHGCLVLLRVLPGQAAKVLKFLGELQVTSDTGTGDKPVADKTIYRNVALTYKGLCALGVPPHYLDKFPLEFIEGMEARAGVLGDLRTNHPDHWTRPTQNWPPVSGAPEATIELSTVHIVLQLRTSSTNPGHALLPEFNQIIAQLGKSGLRVLSVQPMRRYVDGANAVGHFGFVDGLSQPSIAVPPLPAKAWSDQVAHGEILLGYSNDRGDGPTPETPNTLMDYGTFLVVRKLSQRLDVLNDALTAQAAQRVGNAAGTATLAQVFKEKMMGRHADGRPLVTPQGADNDFDYSADTTGAQCPVQSHARRLNPRDSKVLPRIVRRGMSYGPKSTGPVDEGADRGVVFMAYNASISEQFEVLQRWVSGGINSGFSGMQSDPYLGVPQEGQSRTFCFMHNGAPTRIDLGDRPIAQLQWGMYLFVPSIDALKQLPAIVKSEPPEPDEPTKAPVPGSKSPRIASVPSAQTRTLAGAASVSDEALSDSGQLWKDKLEDKDKRDAAWSEVRACPHGVLPTDYGTLVGTRAGLTEVLQDLDGSRFSVAGYGERFSDSIGNGFLGQDVATGQDPHTQEVNALIAGVTAHDAYLLAREKAAEVLSALPRKPSGEDGRSEARVEIVGFIDEILARTCKYWFGLPDPDGEIVSGGGSLSIAPARCPGHFYTVAQYVFLPHPATVVQDLGKAQGKSLHDAAVRVIGKTPYMETAPLAAGIAKIVRSHKGDDERVARAIVGVMQGFPPAVNANLLLALTGWVKSRQLWDLQQDLLAGIVDPKDRKSEKAFAAVCAALQGPLLESMRASPVPAMLWRRPVGDCTVAGMPVPNDKPIVAGILPAMRDKADNDLLFGGVAKVIANGTKATPTAHGCPGRELAMGVMLGSISALLEAGTLRPAEASVVVTLIG